MAKKAKEKRTIFLLLFLFKIKIILTRIEVLKLNDSTISLFEKIKPWLNLKTTEFHLLGYTQISQADLWRYLISFSWKKMIPIHYYQQIECIMQLTPNDYLNFASVEALVSPISLLEDMNIDDLL
ncbi:MAG: post-transcriptional regulator [Carnobacterium sp.]|nr:post-transcriptional regulator [Carnobacterium sp.]